MRTSFPADEPAIAKYQVSANPMKNIWDPVFPFSGPGKEGRGPLTWRIEYVRGPTCTQDGTPNGKPLTDKEKRAEEDYNDDNDDEFWGRARAEKCCACKKKGPDQKCIDDCQMPVNSRARFTSSEVGYYFNFWFDKNGLPKGCPEFDAQFKYNRPGEDKDASKPEVQEALLKVGKIDP